MTGRAALAHFADMLLNQNGGSAAAAAARVEADGAKAELYPELTAAMKAKQSAKVLPAGLQVEVFGLAKQQQFNGAIGVIQSYDAE